MSIDHYYYVAAGMRNSETRRFRDCRDGDAKKMIEHQVFLAHGACDEDGDGVLDTVIAVDEQYYFEDPDDARWFFNTGYKRMLYEGEANPDRMAAPE